MNSSAGGGDRKPPPPAFAAAAARQEKADEEKTEVWFKEEERWELTWPIWHMLPRDERRALANKHGYKTIGEFEEFMTLQRAVGASEDPKAYDNSLAYHDAATNSASGSSDNATSSDLDKKPAVVKAVADEDNEDENSVNEELEEEIENEQIAAADKLPTAELIKCGGSILLLHEEILHKVFAWLPVDAYATLAHVSPHWKSFTRTEAVYKRLCERLYLNQSKRRALHVSRFDNSYRIMLEKRPRVRAMGGVYVMKYARVKKIQRDMWTEIPVGAVLETVYYRYLYFQEDGRVIYALTSTPPHEMFGRLLKLCLKPGETDRAAVWGTYRVQKSAVTVQAKQPWQHVQLNLTIQVENTMHGRYGYLSFDQHMTSASGDFGWGSDRIVFDVPGVPFRFVKDKRL